MIGQQPVVPPRQHINRGHCLCIMAGHRKSRPHREPHWHAPYAMPGIALHCPHALCLRVALDMQEGAAKRGLEGGNAAEQPPADKKPKVHES